MKKIHYLIVALLAINTIACADKSNNNGDKDKDKVVVDTFYTPDLNFADLRGDVKECMTTTVEVALDSGKWVETPESPTTTRIERFDDQGRIATVINNVVFMGENVESTSYTFEYNPDGGFESAYTSLNGTLKPRRGNDGYINTFTSTDITGSTEFVKGYTWADGRLAEEYIVNDLREVADKINPDVANKTSYTYDDKGYLVSATEKFGDPEIELTITETTYDNLKYDRHGNWTERIVTRKASRYAGSMSGRGNLLENNSSSVKETREIEYNE